MGARSYLRFGTEYDEPFRCEYNADYERESVAMCSRVLQAVGQPPELLALKTSEYDLKLTLIYMPP